MSRIECEFICPYCNREVGYLLQREGPFGNGERVGRAIRFPVMGHTKRPFGLPENRADPKPYTCPLCGKKVGITITFNFRRIE